MDLEKIKIKKSERKSIVISVRVRPSQSKWLKQKSYSPTAIFQEALLDLMKIKK